MSKSSCIIMLIFISFFTFISNLPSQKDINSNISIDKINRISKEINLINDNLNISSFFILGFDNYIYDINNKIIKFNLYFLKDNNNAFPNKLYLYLNINYKDKIIRNLQNDNVFKSTCDLISNNKDILDNKIKYECKLSTNGKEIKIIKSLDILEYNSQKIEIQKSSFLYKLYKDNIQNAEEDIFNKPLYILENSIVYSDEKDFNITGNLNINIDKLNNYQILLQFHSDKNKSSFKNSTCYIINEGKSVTNKLGLKCTVNESFNLNIIDGYSKLNNRNLFVIFKNIDNKIQINIADPINLRYLSQSSSDISAGGIIGIIIGSIAIIFIIFYCYKRAMVRRRIRNNELLDEYDPNIAHNGNLFETRFIRNGESFFIPCRREDFFSKVEEKIFQIFPELRYKNIKYLNNSNVINRSSTLIENKINKEEPIMIIEEN